MSTSAGQADSDLMDRVRRGDADAERELYVLHAPHALWRARQAGAQRADAEDYVSEAFIRVLHQLRKGSGPNTHFRAYPVAAVRNIAVDARKGQNGREWATDVLEERTSYASEAADPQEFIGTRMAVRAAMTELPPRWRHILWQIDVEGRKPAAIASESDVSAQSIYALAYRARKALRKAYLETLPVSRSA